MGSYAVGGDIGPFYYVVKMTVFSLEVDPNAWCKSWLKILSSQPCQNGRLAFNLLWTWFGSKAASNQEGNWKLYKWIFFSLNFSKIDQGVTQLWECSFFLPFRIEKCALFSVH